MKELSNNYTFSIVSFYRKLPGYFKFLKRHFKSFIYAGIIGCVIGVVLIFFMPIKYTAKMSFVASESKLNTGGFASLAGQFGVDLGAITGGNGFFSFDNLLYFLKSDGLVREVLLTKYDSTKNETLADFYAESNNLKKKWQKDDKIGIINFAKYTKKELPRTEDSLLQKLVFKLQKNLSVIKPDRKASFIELKVISLNEKFSKIFIENLVNAGVKHYVETLTKPKLDNVEILQKRVDSLGLLLNQSTSAAAISQQPLVDINPALRAAAVSAEIRARNKLVISTIYAEVVKNLELAKFVLQQETPVVKIVDYSHFPLKNNKISLFAAALIGLFLSIIFYTLVLTIRYIRFS
jgi:hypothetical protein